MLRSTRSILILAAAIAVAWGLLAAHGISAQETERHHPELPASQEGWIETGIILGERDTLEVSSAFGRASWDNNKTASGPEGTYIEWCEPIAPELPVGALLIRAGD